MPKHVSAQVVGSNLGTNKIDPKLIGETNEVHILINNIPVTSLLDTGCCESLVSETFYREHLSSIELRPIEDILNTECADGQNLPYLGYIDVEISITTGLPDSKP